MAAIHCAIRTTHSDDSAGAACHIYMAPQPQTNELKAGGHTSENKGIATTIYTDFYSIHFV